MNEELRETIHELTEQLDGLARGGQSKMRFSTDERTGIAVEGNRLGYVRLGLALLHIGADDTPTRPDTGSLVSHDSPLKLTRFRVLDPNTRLREVEKGPDKATFRALGLVLTWTFIVVVVATALTIIASSVIHPHH